MPDRRARLDTLLEDHARAVGDFLSRAEAIDAHRWLTPRAEGKWTPAWATSTSTTQGEVRGRAINSAGAELMVLVRGADGWKISAIHWSSRSRRS
jgi:hypothetical protein